MRKDITAPQRLDFLLPWLNNPINVHAASRADIRRWSAGFRRAIGQFLASFDGSPAAGHVEVLRRRSWPERPRWVLRRPPRALAALDPDELHELQVSLGVLLEMGFSATEGGTYPMPSLEVGARNAHRGDLKLSRATRRERQAHMAPGAYVKQVSGSPQDLVLYLTLHLLTAPGMAGVLGRCPAPAPRNRQVRCHGWFLRTGHGRRREFCSDRCRVRNAAEQQTKTLKGSKKR